MIRHNSTAGQGAIIFQPDGRPAESTVGHMVVRLNTTVVLVAAIAGLAGVVRGVFTHATGLLFGGLALTFMAAGVAIASASRAARKEAPTAIIPDPPTPAPEPASKPSPPTVARPDIEPRGVEPTDVLTALVRNMPEDVSVRAAHLWLLDETTSTMRLVAAVGDPGPTSGLLSAEDSGLGFASRTGTARLDGMSESTWRYSIPLRAGEVVGAAGVDIMSERPDTEQLNRVAAHLRGALSAALALHVSRTEAGYAKTLLDAARELTTLVDVHAIANAVLERALEIANADTGSVMLADEGGEDLRIVSSIGLSTRVVAETTVREGDGIAGWVLATGQPMVIEDPDDKGPNSHRHGVRSAMAIPISDGNIVMGVLNVGCRRYHARFSSSQLDALGSLGGLAALSLRNAHASEAARDLYLDTVRALALALETKDPYSRGSTKRVFELAERLGKAVGMTGADLQALRVAALLHDLGMAAAGGVNAFGKRPLTTVEWGMLKLHPVISADVIDHAPALRAAVPIVYHHHEHYDGQGYVLGVAREQIPLGARVLSVADAYVSMTSPRPYRDALSHDEALEELSAKSGTQFDPVVVGAFSNISFVSGDGE